MTKIDKHIFIEYFVPSKSEQKRKISFDNGSSIVTSYQSENKYLVKYLSGSHADYYSPKFMFRMDGKLKIIPIPNLYVFLFIPLALILFAFIGELEKEHIWKVTITLILFVVLLQLALTIPSIWNIKKRVDEKMNEKTNANNGYKP